MSLFYHSLWFVKDYYSHFTGEKAKAQRGQEAEHLTPSEYKNQNLCLDPLASGFLLFPLRHTTSVQVGYLYLFCLCDKSSKHTSSFDALFPGGWWYYVIEKYCHGSTVRETTAFSSNICEKLLDSITKPERNKTHHLIITISSSRKLLASYFIHRFKKEYYYNYY